MRRLRKDSTVPSVLPERSGHSGHLQEMLGKPVWGEYLTVDDERCSTERDWRKKVKERMEGPWLGKVIRLPYGPSELPYASAWMVTEGATVDDLIEAINIEWQASGDMHHIFIESLDDDGMWILIGTGS